MKAPFGKVAQEAIVTRDDARRMLHAIHEADAGEFRFTNSKGRSYRGRLIGRNHNKH